MNATVKLFLHAETTSVTQTHEWVETVIAAMREVLTDTAYNITIIGHSDIEIVL